MSIMQAVECFQNDSSKTVLLASLKSFGMGVDLTCASQVILVAPSRNLAVRGLSILSNNHWDMYQNTAKLAVGLYSCTD